MGERVNADSSVLLSRCMRKQVRYSGRVQGVGFRATARSVALGHAVTGWVRNEPDGSVLMEIQGESKEIDLTLDGIRQEMRGHIHGAGVVELPEVVGEIGFEIRR